MAVKKEGSEERFRCRACGKHFSRADSLKRHQAVHDSSHFVKPRRRSCLACSKAKVRCSGQRPSCAACMRKSMPCDYGSCRSPSPDRSSRTSSSLHEMDLDQTDVATDLAGILDQGAIFSDTASLSQANVPPRGSQPVSFSEALDPGRTGRPLPPFDTHPDPTPYTPDSGSFQLGTPIARSRDDFGDLRSVRSNSGPKTVSSTDWAAPTSEQLRTLLPIPRTAPEHNVRDPSSTHRVAPSPRVEVFSFVHRSVPQRGYKDVGSHSTVSEDFDFRALQGMLLQPSLPMASLDSCPTKTELEGCVALYFKKCHCHLPVIHRPTFVLAEAPVVLMLAMAALGACLGGFDGCAAMSRSLSAWTRRLLGFMLETNPSYRSDQTFLTAQLLHATFGRLSGDITMFDTSESSRAGLLDNLLLQRLHRLERTFVFPGYLVEQEWRLWTKEETSSRLAWALCEHDSMSCTVFNKRPALRLSNMKTHLPGDDDFWESTSAEQWYQLYQAKPSRAVGPYFPDVIKDMMASEDEAPIRQQNIMHIRLLISSVSRMLWTWKDVHALVPKTFDRIPGWQEAGNPVHHAATRIGWMSREIYAMLIAMRSKPNMSCVVGALQMAHMSLIQSVGDLINWSFASVDLERQVAIGRVKEWKLSWASEAPDRLRQVAWNCGQLLGLAHRWPTGFPQQPYCIFHAGTVLWCIAPLINEPPQQHDGQASDTTDRRILVLDRIPRLEFFEMPVTATYAAALMQRQRDMADWYHPSGDSSTQATLEDVPDIGTEEGRRKILEVTADLLANPLAPAISHRLEGVVREMLSISLG